MDIKERVAVLVSLGKRLERVVNDSEQLSEAETHLKNAIPFVFHSNQWFTIDSVLASIRGVIKLLKEDELLLWYRRYMEGLARKQKHYKVGLIMAGNIPLVGFHDFISVFLAGDHAKIKLSSDDKLLLPLVFAIAEEIDPRFSQSYTLVEGFLKDIDKVIATGGNNTSRYFRHYFSSYPNVIRRSRASMAVLEESVTAEDIALLANDIFTFYGLGCRNVSKLMIHQKVDLIWLMDELSKYDTVSSNHKYVNNLIFQKSVYLIDKVPFLDGGFFLLRESPSLFSPISVIHYERFEDNESIEHFIKDHQENLQCLVGKTEGRVSFGQAQTPQLWDYADQVDTMEFLLND